MTAEGWRMLVRLAVEKADRGDPSGLDLLVRHLVDVDKAKQIFRDKGYGYSTLVETAKEMI